MLTFRTLLSLPVFVSSTLIAYALAAPAPANTGFIDSSQDGLTTDFAAQLTGGEECDDMDMEQIRKGFNEMTVLFQSAVRPDWTGEAELEYFGKPTRIANYTSMIEGNLLRAAQYANLRGDATRNPDIHVRCDDPNDMCGEGSKKDGKHAAYNIGNEPHVNFCKKFFNLDPLDKKVDEEAGNMKTNRDVMQYYNRATAWARQVMHISAVGTAIVERPVLNSQSNSTREWTTTISNGAMNTSVLAGVSNSRPKLSGPNNVQTLKYAYGATRAKLVAMMSTQEPYDAANNAENYALYAQARYVMLKKNFYPNVPIMQIPDEMVVLMNDQLQDGGEERYACYDAKDVLPRKAGTSSIGGPIQSSSASSMMRSSIRLSDQASVALYCTLVCCIFVAILG